MSYEDDPLYWAFGEPPEDYSGAARGGPSLKLPKPTAPPPPPPPPKKSAFTAAKKGASIPLAASARKTAATPLPATTKPPAQTPPGNPLAGLPGASKPSTPAKPPSEPTTPPAAEEDYSGPGGGGGGASSPEGGGEEEQPQLEDPLEEEDSPLEGEWDASQYGEGEEEESLPEPEVGPTETASVAESGGIGWLLAAAALGLALVLRGR